MMTKKIQDIILQDLTYIHGHPSTSSALSAGPNTSAVTVYGCSKRFALKIVKSYSIT